MERITRALCGLGCYISARLQAFGHSAAQLAQCRSIIEALERELNTGCLGSLAEIYDGDAPHRPLGAAAQAWSVAETLRILALFQRTG